MPQYRYRAIDHRGRQIRGHMAAANERDLSDRLSDIRLELIDFTDLEKKQRTGLMPGRVLDRDRIQTCIHIATLLEAGVPLLDCLEDARDSTDKPGFKDVLTEIYRDVAEGESLSKALARHPKAFNRVFVAVIAAGEETGDLSGAFRHLADHISWTYDMRQRMRRATRYPIFLFVLLLVMFAVLMTYTMPQIILFLDSLDADLPLYTQALIATSNIVTQFWYLFLTIPVGLFFGIRYLYRSTPDFARSLDAMLLNLPVAGEMIQKYALAQFSNMFALLYGSGVPVLQCLDSASNIVQNRVLSEAIDRIRAEVQSGSSISFAMARAGVFPSLVLRMVRVGEEAGALDKTLTTVAEFYGADVEEASDDFINMIQPTLIIITALLLLWIGAGTLLPVYQSSTFAG